jgi:hypothetical protein
LWLFRVLWQLFSVLLRLFRFLLQRFRISGKIRIQIVYENFHSMDRVAADQSTGCTKPLARLLAGESIKR